ncbi:hypothetical protein D0T49_00845 [Paludibacter sp. 221]|nr:hypothetical protein [Paludibacter sp. 221]
MRFFCIVAFARAEAVAHRIHGQNGITRMDMNILKNQESRAKTKDRTNSNTVIISVKRLSTRLTEIMEEIPFVQRSVSLLSLIGG